jgi:ribosomal protein L32
MRRATADKKYPIAKSCPTCGGTHIGHRDCPFTSAPCVVCEEPTVMACSDCAIDSGGRKSVHVCARSSCRLVHERQHNPRRP